MSKSTLAQVISCCLMAPSHYRNPCWLLAPIVFCGIHSPENCIRIVCEFDPKHAFGDYRLNITATPHGANMGPTWVLSAPDRPVLAPWILLSGLINACGITAYWQANYLGERWMNRDCKSRRHILWHCTSSLSWWWHGINLDWDYTWAFKSPSCVILTIAQSP